jgi:hypothetical protein
MTSQRAPPLRKLPVWSAVGACYALVARNLGQLMRIAWFLLLIIMPLYAVTYWLTWPWSAGTTGEVGGLISQLLTWLPSLIELPFLASIAVAWHRLLLRQERFTGNVYFRFDAPVWRYTALSLGLLVASSAPFFYSLSPTPTEIEVGIVIGVFVLAIAMSLLMLPRLSIALPGIALDERLTLVQAWRMTRGNSWRLALATLLCALPTVMIFVPLYWYFDWQPRTSSVILQTLTSLIETLTVTIGVTLLSLAYRFFVLQQGNATTPPA